jgi:selenocysteine-specific elongation factor
MQGQVRTGDTVTFQPSGKGARVRSLHVFGKPREWVTAGSRVALNVPAIDRRAIGRGEAVVGREFSGRTNLDVRFTPLSDALRSLQRRTPVHAYVGSAEVLGTLLLESVPEEAQEMRARLVLREPVVAFAGVRFVVRRLSPRVLLGGGCIDGIDAASVAMDGASPAETAITAALAERGTSPSTPAELAAAVNLREDVVETTLSSLVERGDAVRVLRPEAYVHARAAREYLAAVNAFLDELHRDEPWAMGATSIAMARATNVPEALAVRLLAALAEQGRIVNRGGYYAAVDFTPSLTSKQREFFDGAVPVDSGNPFVPVPFEGVAAAVRTAPFPGAGKALDTLLARGALVRVGDFVYRGSQIAQIQARTEQFLGRSGKMTAADFRDLLGTSRKYAVPLLEWLDARGITLRSGDHRMLRKKTS